ncbi:hypothetical protein HYH02_000317 [Chlamydomonas schloesseri]|uniref:Uncharacterized protein n=1 Tax=Chlamydomonas schloesseri TaxID=2026947 RepID=A0A836B7R5_9CHLO|nr:hypothetical protein HYH02_000317 [Chlamydomonas schloesseri]|eukprot:KAG2450216.1 hypothetical protein HYH02_000317 [Chlamydomonas schloesseri]
MDSASLPQLTPVQLEDGLTQDLLTLFDEQEDGNDVLRSSRDLFTSPASQSRGGKLQTAGSNTVASTWTARNAAASAGPTSGLPPSSPPGGDAPQKRTSASGKRDHRHRVRDNEKLREMEALAAAKLEQYLALTQRNADLKLRNAVLSEALVIRDAQLSTSAGKPWSVPPLPAELAAATSLAAAARLPGSMKLVCIPGPDPSQDSVRAMGRQQLMDTHQAFLAELSAPLLAFEDNPADEAAAAAIHDVLTRLCSLYRMVSVVAPDTMAGMIQSHLETREVCAAPPGHWAGVLQKLELTPQQVAQLTALYGLFRGLMEKITVERRAINARLTQGLAAQEQKEAQRAAAAAAAAPASAAGAHSVDGGGPEWLKRHSSSSGVSSGPGSGSSSGSGGATASHQHHHQHHQLEVPPEAEVLPALSRNLRKESAAHLLLRGFFFGCTLSILQAARAMVHSYPWFPNATALIAAAAGVPNSS